MNVLLVHSEYATTLLNVNVSIEHLKIHYF